MPQIYRTDPTNLPSPTIGVWTVLFTRKVAAGAASDSDYVDTGIVYDSSYEYLVYNVPVTAPTPNPTTSLATIAGVNILTRAIYGTYKPDGVNALNDPGGLFNVLVEAAQDPSAILVAPTWGVAATLMKLDALGKFYTKWTQDMAKDGHFCIARRRRYG